MPPGLSKIGEGCYPENALETIGSPLKQLLLYKDPDQSSGKYLQRFGLMANLCLLHAVGRLAVMDLLPTGCCLPSDADHLPLIIFRVAHVASSTLCVGLHPELQSGQNQKFGGLWTEWHVAQSGISMVRRRHQKTQNHSGNIGKCIQTVPAVILRQRRQAFHSATF